MSTSGSMIIVGSSTNSPPASPSTGGTLVLNAGVTLQNNGLCDGSAVYLHIGTFTMDGGTITGNNPGNNGGGTVYIGGSAIFTMNGGSITSNNATSTGSGGGVRTSGIFEMTGGTINGNTADMRGDNLDVLGGTATYGGSLGTGNILATATGEGYTNLALPFKLNGVVKPVGPDYGIGSTGPAGGIIFYVDDGTFGGGTWTYLEAAPADIPGLFVWATTNTNIATDVATGKGQANTAAILAVESSAPAAAACVDYGNGTAYDDWFLPSKNELDAMRSSGIVGETVANEITNPLNNFSLGNYWSSSECTSDHAWFQRFSNDNQANYYKGSTYGVRAVRAF